MPRSLLLTSFGTLILGVIVCAFVLTTTIENHQGVAIRLVHGEIRFPNPEDLQPIDGSVDPRGVDPSFTYQGVLKDSNGNPASGPVDLRFRLHSTIPDPVDFSILTTTVTPDPSGVFQVEIDLPDSALLSAASDLLLEIKEPASSETIALVPVQYAPRAWVSDYARVAGSADIATNSVFSTFATFANSATSANTANQLTNDQTISLSFSQSQFSPHLSYSFPKAARVGNVVTLQGAILVNGPISNGMEVFVLPEGFRPAGPVMLPIHHSQSFLNGGNLVSPPMRFEVQSDGRVIMQNVPPSGTTPIISLNTASFIVE